MRALCLCLLFLSACAALPQPPTPTPTNTPTPQPTPTDIPTRAPLPTARPTLQIFDDTDRPGGRLRLVHALPDAEAIDAYIGDEILASSIAFTRSSGQVIAEEGLHTVRITEAGAGPQGEVIGEMELDVKRDTSTLVLFTLIDDAPAIVFIDETPEPLQGENTAVRVVHAVVGGGRMSPRVGSQIVADSLLFTQVNNVAIAPSGTTDMSFGTFVEGYSIGLRPLNTYTFTVVGTPDFARVVSFDQPSPGGATLAVVNTSVDFDEIDVVLNGETIEDGMDFGVISAVQELRDGIHTVQIFEPGADQTRVEPLIEDNIRLARGDSLKLILIGPASDLRLRVHRMDLSATPPDEGRIAIINTLPNAPVLTETRIEEVNTVVYGQGSTVVGLDPATYNFGWSFETDDEDDNINFLEELRVSAGVSYLYLVTDSEETVFIAEDVAVFEDPNAPEPGVIYFANGVESTDGYYFIVDGVLTTRAAAFGEIAGPIEVDEGEHELGVSDFDTLEGQFFEGRAITTTPGDRVVLHFVPGPDGFFRMVPFEAPAPTDPNRQAASIRLLNMDAPTGVGLRFGYTGPREADRRPTILHATQIAEDPAQPTPFAPSNTVRPIPADIERGRASDRTLMQPGRYDIYVTDAANNRIAAVVYDVELMPNTDYDLVVRQAPPERFPAMLAFLTAYP